MCGRVTPARTYRPAGEMALVEHLGTLIVISVESLVLAAVNVTREKRSFLRQMTAQAIGGGIYAASR